jgi:LPS-assembly protein
VFDRLGIDDSFEQGRSLTAGLSYKKQRLDDINKFFEFQLASVFRDKEDDFIPKSSSLNKKNSALFGSINSKLSENIKIDYGFRVDNNYERFEKNSITTNLIFQNLDTTFSWVEENGDVGDANFLSNSTTYEFNDQNFITFNTRRNRKINFTEYYDLLYEYKNDCLVASVKYKKQFYSDRDLKPNENLLFSITFYPFTSYEHNETNLYIN